MILIIILFIILSYCIYLGYETNETNIIDKSLEKDGYITIQNSNKPTDGLKYLKDGYVVMNYKYVIKGCTLQTFHRDVTSSAYVFNTKHPTYTYITYKNKGPILSVCSGSHNSTPFLWNRPHTVVNNTNNNMGILFNCDLVHAGAINDLKEKRFATQYKIVHKDDLDKLSDLNNIYKVQSGNCTDTSFARDIILRKLSLYACYPINHIFTPYLQSDQKNIINKLAIFIFGKSFYNL